MAKNILLNLIVLVPALVVEVLGPGHDVITVVITGGANVKARPGLHVAQAEVIGCHSTWFGGISRSVNK